jgi:hypothetical protein
MKGWIFLLMTYFSLSGCSNGNSAARDLLSTVDTVRLVEYGLTKTIKNVTTKSEIRIFTDIIHLKDENLPSSKVFKEIEYYSKGKLILKAFENNEGIEYSYNGKKYSERITYRAGMYNEFTSDSIISSVHRNEFDSDSAFEIISYVRSTTRQSSAPDTNMCKGWTMSESHLYQVIKHAKPIGGTEWDLNFDVLPCIMKGQLKQNGYVYDFEVNSGSWLYLKQIDTTLIFGDYNQGDRKLFIQGPNNN